MSKLSTKFLYLLVIGGLVFILGLNPKRGEAGILVASYPTGGLGGAAVLLVGAVLYHSLLDDKLDELEKNWPNFGRAVKVGFFTVWFLGEEAPPTSGQYHSKILEHELREWIEMGVYTADEANIILSDFIRLEKQLEARTLEFRFRDGGGLARRLEKELGMHALSAEYLLASLGIQTLAPGSR